MANTPKETGFLTVRELARLDTAERIINDKLRTHFTPPGADDLTINMCSLDVATGLLVQNPDELSNLEIYELVRRFEQAGWQLHDSEGIFERDGTFMHPIKIESA